MDNRKYRECVRIIITRGNLILLGSKFINNKFICYEFPGGGIEEGDTIEKTIIKECLEEVGIIIKHIVNLNIQYKYEIKYPDSERAKIYKGGVDNWFTAEFAKDNKKLYNIEGDSMPYRWVTINETIKLIEGGPESEYNSARLEAINKVKKLKIKQKPLLSKW